MLSIYNKISDYIIVLNNRGKIVFCNESFLNRLSYNQDEILNLNISKIITNGYNNILKGSEEANKTLEFHAKSNEIVKINSNISIENFNNDKNILIIGKEVQSKPYTMEILEDILDNIDVCTFVLDNDGKYLYVNKPFTNILNKKREDIIGTYNSEYWEEHTYKTLEENNIEVFEGKSAKIFHEEVAICDNINWYESYKAPIFDEFIGIIGLSYSNGNSPKFNSDEYMKYICNKIAMLIKNIRLLNEVSIENKKRKYTEKELEQYLDVSVNLVAIVDKNGYFKRVNFSWYNVLRWTEEELLSMSCKDIIHPEESIKFKDKKKL